LSAHTPTPWEFVEEPYDASEADLFCRSIYSGGYKGLLVARADQDFSKADAAFIVKAVNAHGDMLAALQTLVASAESVLAELKPGQSLAPAGATKTNILASDVNAAKRAIAGAAP